MKAPRQISDVTRRIPILLTGATLESLVPAWRTSMLTVVELATASFFVWGIAVPSGGIPAPWFVLAAVIAAMATRAADVEGWALFVPGGLSGRVNHALGHRFAAVASAAVLIERLLFVALASVAAAHYVVATVGVLFDVPICRITGPSTTSRRWQRRLLVTVIWLRTRVDRPLGATDVVRWDVDPAAGAVCRRHLGRRHAVSRLEQPAAADHGAARIRTRSPDPSSLHDGSICSLCSGPRSSVSDAWCRPSAPASG